MKSIENRILIPFMFLIIGLVLILAITSIKISYDSSMEYKIKEMQISNSNIEKLIDLTNTDYNMGQEDILEFLQDKKDSEEFFLLDGDELVIGPADTYHQDRSTNDYVLVDDYISDLDWTYGYIISKEDILNKTLNENKIMILISIVSLILSMQLAIIVSYNISKPIKRLASYYDTYDEDIDSGGLVIDRDDEIGNLSKKLNLFENRIEKSKVQMVQMESLSTIGQFAAGIAHEIRNPLTGIKTSIQLLKRRRDKDLEILERMDDATERINVLIRDLLEFSTPREPVFVKIPAKAIILECIKDQSQRLRDKGISLKTKNISGEIFAYADKYQLKQVISNILSNAITFVDQGGQVQINLGMTSQSIIIEIIDNGLGIKKEDYKNLYKPFYSTRPGGTGLGLSIVHELVGKNKGSILIESEENQGTKVSLEFLKYEEQKHGKSINNR